MSAHSMPVNILAECGLIGAIGWCAIWLLCPLGQFVRTLANPWTMITLLIGFANIFDTGWLLPRNGDIC